MAYSIGGGAAEGLERVLEDRFREALMNQRTREHQDDLGLRRQQLEQQAARDRETADARRRDDDWRVALHNDALQQRQHASNVRDNAQQDLAGLTQLYHLAADPQSRLQLEQQIVNRGGQVVKPQAAGRPLLVGPGQTVLDPETFEPRYTAPVRTGTLRMRDATFPGELQTGVFQLRTQHPTFDSAVSALVQALPGWQQQYPEFEPQKAVNALRQAYTGAAGTADPLDTFLDEVLGPGGGRAGGPASTSGPSSIGGGASQAADLGATARQVLEANGYDATPENIERFLANPANRARLTGGR